MKQLDSFRLTQECPMWVQTLKSGGFMLAILFSLLFITSTSIAQGIPESYADGKTADWNDRSNPRSSYIVDAVNSHDDDQFTQGSKDEDEIEEWRWSPGNANDKGDITNAGAQITDNNCILRFFGDRTAVNGSAAISFWFFVNPVGKMADGTFSGEHTNGDVLIISDFVNGGKVAEFSAYMWMDGNLMPLSTDNVDWGAAVNSEEQPVPAGLAYSSKDKQTEDGVYPMNAFFEGAINLCQLKEANPGLNTCFSSFMVQTRNSHSINASLQDLAGGNFNSVLEAPVVMLTQPTCAVATGAIVVTSATAGLEFSLNGAAYATYPENGYTGLTPGNYTLQVRNMDGCASAQVEVTITAPLEGPNANAGADMMLTCTTTSLTLAGASTTAGATFAWVASDGGNIVSGSDSATPTVNAAGTYTLTVTANGCTATDVVKVTQDAATPNVSAMGGTLSCLDGSLQLKGASTSANVTFSWTGPDNFTSGEQNPTVTMAGDYTLTVTSTVTGCSAKATVTVHPQPAGSEPVVTCHMFDLGYENHKPGLISTLQTKEGPVSVMGMRRHPDGTYAAGNHAALFDTQAPTGDDTDLYTTDWGLALIINQDLSNVPNDNQWGGELILDFSAIGPVTMESLRALDIDNYENMAWIYLYDGAGNELYKVQLQNLGDNSKQDVNLGNTKGVMKMRVVMDGRNDMGSLAGSGAIDDIKFCVEREVQSPCVDTEATAAVSISNVQAYPTPFSERATIQFKLQNAENYVVNLYDLQGNLVGELKSGRSQAGEVTSVDVTGEKLQEGLYLARIVTESGTRTVKLLLKK